MKKLVIRSEDEKEDMQAAIQITNAMIKGQADQIVWYSKMGQKTEEMKAATKAMLNIARNFDALMKRQNECEGKLCDLKFRIQNVEESLKDLVAKVSEICPKKKKGAKDDQDNVA